MVRRNGQVILAALLALAIAMPAAAQMGGMVKGKVLDDKGQPVVGANVTITAVDTSRKFQTKSDKRGEYMQIGLTSGGYTVVAEKDKLVSAQQKATVRAGSPAEVDLIIGVSAAASSADAAASGAALTKAFDEGVAAQKAGNFDAAIEKFNEGIAVNPQCFSCYNGIGRAYVGKKDYDKAEVALKKSIELRPTDAEAYSELANMYNASENSISPRKPARRPASWRVAAARAAEIRMSSTTRASFSSTAARAPRPSRCSNRSSRRTRITPKAITCWA